MVIKLIIGRSIQKTAFQIIQLTFNRCNASSVQFFYIHTRILFIKRKKFYSADICKIEIIYNHMLSICMHIGLSPAHHLLNCLVSKTIRCTCSKKFYKSIKNSFNFRCKLIFTQKSKKKFN